MKKSFLAFFVAIECLGLCSARAEVLIKKASPVATQSSSSTDAVSSLVPTVLNLVSGIQQLTAAQNQLTEECTPSTQEIAFVNETVKEWAKTGTITAKEVESQLGIHPCTTSNNGIGGYERSIKLAAGDKSQTICYDYLTGTGNTGMVWENFPVVTKVTYCSDGTPDDSCSAKSKKTASNIYNVFNLIDFTEEDYTVSEATMAAKLIAKIETCSDAKLSAKKRAAWGEFLINTAGSLGQKTNTGTIMDALKTNGLGTSGALKSLGSIATQFMN